MVNVGDLVAGNNIKLHGGLRTGCSNSENPTKEGEYFYMKY